MLEALKAGYATMSTDNGHVTDTTQPNGGSEQTWALGHPEKMMDFALRALHLSTIAAKTGGAPLLWHSRRAGILFRRLFARRPSRPDGSDAAIPPIMTAWSAGAAPWQWTRLMLGAHLEQHAGAEGPQRHDALKAWRS